MEKLYKNQKYYYDVELSKAKLNNSAKVDLHNRAEFDINWAVKLLEKGYMVYRKSKPEIFIFPPSLYENSEELKLSVEDIFAQDWVIANKKTLKEVLDDFLAGKTIRRRSWHKNLAIGKYVHSTNLNMRDLLAEDWEVIDTLKEVNDIQEEHIKNKNMNCS